MYFPIFLDNSCTDDLEYTRDKTVVKEIVRISIHKVYFITPDEINVEPTDLKAVKVQSFESFSIYGKHCNPFKLLVNFFWTGTMSSV